MMVAPLDGDRPHGGGASRLDVAQVVAEIAARGGGELEPLGGEEKRSGVRLEMRRRVPADHAGWIEAEVRDDALGEAERLVGHDAPGNAASVQLGQQRL